MDAGRNFALKIAAKPLEIETLATYNNLALLYPTVPLPTRMTYRSATIHALQTHRQTTDITLYYSLSATKTMVGQNSVHIPVDLL